MSPKVNMTVGQVTDIVFRANPSTAFVPTDITKWALDQLTTRASYVKPSSNFSIVSILPDGANEGQYIAKIKCLSLTSVNEYFMALVLNTNTSAAPVLISSPMFTLGPGAIYNPYDISKINDLIEFCNLNWTKSPADGSACHSSWTGITWSNDAVNKRITKINLENKDLYIHIWLDNLSKLEELHISLNSSMSTLVISGCSALKKLYANNCNINDFNYEGCSALEELHVGGNKLSNLNDINTICPNLQHLSCATNNLIAIDVSGLNKLWFIDCCYNNISSLNISGCTALEWFNCAANSLNGFTYAGYLYNNSPKLQTLFLYKNNMGTAFFHTIFNQLPDRTGLTNGAILIAVNPGAGAPTDYQQATDKNWLVDDFTTLP
jgi:hypothetical protein